MANNTVLNGGSDLLLGSKPTSIPGSPYNDTDKPYSLPKVETQNTTSFSGSDATVYIMLRPDKVNTTDQQPGSYLKKLGEISTLSYSIYRQKSSVVPLGYTFPKGFTRGPRTIAGTMIFTVFDKSVFSELTTKAFLDAGTLDDKANYILIDQLPPLDIYVSFQNEYGDTFNDHGRQRNIPNMSKMAIFGVELINEGQVVSIEDLFTENSVNFIAKHISPMEKVDGRELEVAAAKMNLSNSGSAKNLLTDSYFKEAKDDLQTIRESFY